MSEVHEAVVEISREEYERLKRMENNLFPLEEPAMIDTGPNGLVPMVAMWVSAELGNPKILKLSTGGYCYESGLPVDRRKAFDIIPAGKERDEALYWFDTRFDEDKTTKQGIIVHPDLKLTFEDGTPVKNISEITQAIKPGMHQEFLIRCFMAQEVKTPTEIPEWMEKKEEKRKEVSARKVMKRKVKPRGKAAKEVPPATPPPLEPEMEARVE